MIETVVGGMPNAHRHFLLSFERGEPKWELLGVDAINELPAIKWRQHNLNKPVSYTHLTLPTILRV